MVIREFNYNEDNKALYIVFSTKADGDDYFRSIWLSIDDIEYYSPTIISEFDLPFIEEDEISEILNEYFKENELPEEQNL
jgi:hypothetical protein